MSRIQHYIIRQNEDSFYVFPVELSERFDELLQLDSIYADELFYEEFSEYAFENIEKLEFKGIII